MRKLNDYTQFKNILPYASELIGVYQSLLGWKSLRIEKRFRAGLEADKKSLLAQLADQFEPVASIARLQNCNVELRLGIGRAMSATMTGTDSYLVRAIAGKLPAYADYRPQVWDGLLNEDALDGFLRQEVTSNLSAAYRRVCGNPFEVGRLSAQEVERLANSSFDEQVRYESSVAGALLALHRAGRAEDLVHIFYRVSDHRAKVGALMKVLASADPQDAYLDINNINPRDRQHLQSVGLSPISVVHLFRQYFFEFDTFLGTPIEHVWLSPGASVELIEVTTRRTLEERTSETSTETIVRTETSTTDQDDISDAIKQDNKTDIKFGAAADVNQGWIGGEANASTSLDINTTQQTARENTHKRMRQQTEKLSTEIRKNYKSTFKIVTETTDTSSKRYLLANGTLELVNYEMRRKMRQVGVQVQDVGTYLCWQAYVDDPGADLGLGRLLHIAKTPDTSQLQHPEKADELEPFTSPAQVTIPFSQASGDAGDKDEPYRFGAEVDMDVNEGSYERIQYRFEQTAVCEKSNYDLTNVTFDTQGQPIQINRDALAIKQDGTKWRFMVEVEFVNFQGKDALTIGATLHWTPQDAANEAVRKANEAKAAEFKAKEMELYRREYVNSARERIKIASKIAPRKYEDLRDEERIVVYRRLIQDLLTKGVSFPDDRSRHIVAELINAIFDVDKMLYFVSPEWWRPRLHRSEQVFGKAPTPQVGVQGQPIIDKVSAVSPQAAAVATVVPTFAPKVLTSGVGGAKADTSLLNQHVVGWSDGKRPRADDYYITEESEPARMGSSLGWLLQLDGDDLRNAFLNAPWVKAVIPVRPGREEAAINWLTQVEGFNGIGDADVYHASSPDEKDLNGVPLDGQKMMDVIMDLARKVKLKHEAAVKTGKYPKQDPADPQLVDENSIVTATPIDRVYEHGFYPLHGGFRSRVGDEAFEVFDQWVEILPTDQVVPVPVKYDPKTGRQL